MRVLSQFGLTRGREAQGNLYSPGGRQGPRGSEAAELTSSSQAWARECVGGRSGEGALELGGAALAGGQQG